MTSLGSEMVPWALALRSFGFLLSLPFGELLTIVPRFFLAVGLGVILQPESGDSGGVDEITLIFEFVIGFLLGAPLRLLSDVGEMLGEVIDGARGQTISAVLDPLNGQGASDLATIVRSAAVVLAVWEGAIEVSLQGLAESVRRNPPGIWAISPSLALEILDVCGSALLKGFQIGAIWFGAFLMIEVICAIASRLVVGLSFSHTSHLVKSLVTFILLAILLARGESGILAAFVEGCLPRSLLKSP